MDTFREWLSDNLRYILLILIIALLGLFIFFGIRFVRSRIASPEPETQDASTPVYSSSQDAESNGSEAAPAEVTSSLSDQISDPVRSAVETYFAAAATGDTEALRSVVDTLSDADAEEFLASGTTVYSDLKMYSKPGLTEDELAMFVTYQYLNEDEGTALPGLSSFYMTGGDSPKIKTVLTAEEENYLTRLEDDEDVKDPISRVRTDYVNAIARAAEGSEEPAPAPSESSEGETAEESTPEPAPATGGNAGQEPQTAPAQEVDGFKAGSTYTITTDCNVRSGPGYDNASMGVIKAGTEVEYVETSGGWHHIRGGGFDGYVGGSFLR